MEQPEITPELARTLSLLEMETAEDLYDYIAHAKENNSDKLADMFIKELPPEHLKHFKCWFETTYHYEALDNSEDGSFERHFQLN